MYCNFCGKNFDSIEGFEEVSHGSQHAIRCESCTQSHMEEEYDWRREMYGRSSSGANGFEKRDK